MKGSKIAKIISLLVMILAVVFALLWYSNGFESFAFIYAKFNGAVVKNELVLPAHEGEIKVQVKTAGFALKDSVSDYTVSIKAAADDDFTYTVGGEEFSYNDAGDLTEFISVGIFDGYFIIDCSELDVQTLLSANHGGKAVAIPELTDTNPYFSLTIASGWSSKTYAVSFCIEPTGLNLPYGSVIFGESSPTTVIPTLPTEPPLLPKDDGYTDNTDMDDDSDDNATDNGADDNAADDGNGSSSAAGDGSESAVAELSETAKSFIISLHLASTSANNQLIGFMTNAEKYYDNVTAAEKSHPYLQLAYQAYSIMSDSLKTTGTLSDEIRQQAIEILNQIPESALR